MEVNNALNSFTINHCPSPYQAVSILEGYEAVNVTLRSARKQGVVSCSMGVLR